jgi:hypothetical protein
VRSSISLHLGWYRVSLYNPAYLFEKKAARTMWATQNDEDKIALSRKEYGVNGERSQRQVRIN